MNYKGPDLDYFGKEIYVGSNETKVIFVDVSDKRDPKLISEFFYDDEVLGFEISDDIRERLLNGNDDIEITLKESRLIDKYENENYNLDSWKLINNE